MTSIYPIPVGRSSTVLAHAQILHQLQGSSLNLLKTQAQIASGRRVLMPSDDPRASIRTISLQRILEQKVQAKTNLTVAKDYLAASDQSLSSASSSLISVRASALTAMSNLTTDQERDTVVAEIDAAISHLLSISNTEYRGRTLFSGGTGTGTAFEAIGQTVVFRGNDVQPVSMVDLDRLFASGAVGSQVFGAYTDGPVGTVDVDPALTRRVPLADLRGGLGVTSGWIEVSDGTTTRAVDLTNAKTVGDVIDRLEATSFPGRQLQARLQGDRLTLTFDGVPGWELSVGEVGGGTTAAQLGLPVKRPVSGQPLVGASLDPRLTAQTPIGDAFGTRATGFFTPAGINNDIAFEALTRGPDGNQISVHLVDDRLLQAKGSVVAGSETVTYSPNGRPAVASLALAGSGNDLILTANAAGSHRNNIRVELVDGGPIGDAATATYDPSGRVLRLGIDSGGGTSVAALMAAIDNQGLFTASYDNSDPADGPFDPTGTVAFGDIGNVAGQTGSSGGDPGTIFVHVNTSGTTANDVVRALQNDPITAGLVSVRAEAKDSPDPFRLGQGLVTAGSVRLTGGQGQEPDLASGLQLIVGNTTHVVQFDGVQTVGDMLARLSPPGSGVVASISPDGRSLTVRSAVSGVPFSIGENGGSTATDLGLRSFMGTTPLVKLNQGQGVDIQPGTDFLIRRSDGVELAIDLTGAATVDDILGRINNHPDNIGPVGQLSARLAEFGNGLVLTEQSPVSTAGPTIEMPSSAGTAAWDLGLLPVGVRTTPASSMQAATPATVNVSFPPPGDRDTAITLTGPTGDTQLNGVAIRFVDSGAVVGNTPTATFDPAENELVVDVQSGITTAASVLAAINAEGTFTATLNTVDDPTNDGSGAVSGIGLVGTTEGAATASIRTGDPSAFENQSVFDTLIRLREAVMSGDTEGIGRLTDRLDGDITRINVARSELGQRGQTLDTLESRLLDEEVQLKAAISGEIDVDLAEAISSMQLQQAAMQASLQLIGQTVQLTLLSFI